MWDRHPGGQGWHPEAPCEAGEVGTWEPPEAPKAPEEGQLQGPYPGSGQPKIQTQAGQRMD